MKQTNSILDTVKNGLNILLEVIAFDPELIVNINSVLASIVQMGIGPDEGFEITGQKETWDDFLGENDKRKLLIKTLVIEKVRKLFDPPSNSIVAKARDEMIKEYEVRLFMINEDDVYKSENITDNKVENVSDFAKFLTLEKLNYSKGKEWIEKQYKPSLSACSSIKIGKYFARNFDFYYNWQLDVVIKTLATKKHHATLGVVSGIKELTKEYIENNKNSELFEVIPFAIVDGINDAGVFVNTNVVRNEKGLTVGTKPLKEKLDSICMSMLPRYILDNFDSANEAIEYIKNYVSVYSNKKLWNIDCEAHYMIGDAYHTYCLEFINNEIKVTETNTLTNFFLDGVVFNNDRTVYTPETKDSHHDAIKTNKITEYGQGLERWNEMVSFKPNTVSLEEVSNFMTKTINYNNSYTKDNNIWYTEFVGKNTYNKVTVASNTSDFDYVLDKAKSMFITRNRDDDIYGVWHTTHTSIYDLSSKRLYFYDSSENGKQYIFSLE